MTAKFDLIVVGAGVLGTFHAFHAVKKGKSVLLLEKDSTPRGATVRNFGQIVPSGMSAGKWQQYGVKSTQIYREIQSEFDITVRKDGSLYIASNQQEVGLLEELASINRQNGYPSTLLRKEDCLKKYPSIKEDYCLAGLFFPEEITVEPDKMIGRLIEYLSSIDLFHYRPYTTVTEAFSSGSEVKVIDTLGKEFIGEKLIICSGSNFKELYPEIFYESDIEVSKLQMMQTKPLKTTQLSGSILTGLSIRRYESFKECPSYSQLDPHTYDAAFADYGIHILFKQAIDGSLIIGDSHEYADAKEIDTLGFEINQEINEWILREAKRIIHLPSWDIARFWAGYYAQSKNSDLFHHHIDERIQIITAIGGKGMTGSAGLAEEVISNTF